MSRVRLKQVLACADTASAAPREDHRIAEEGQQGQYDGTDSPFSDSSPYTSPFLVHHPDGALDETSGSSVYPELSFAFAKETDHDNGHDEFAYNFNGQSRLNKGYSHSHAQAQSHTEAKSAQAQAQATKRALLQLLPPEKRSFAFNQPLNFAESDPVKSSHVEKDVKVDGEGDLPFSRPPALRLIPSANLEDDDVNMQQEHAVIAPASTLAVVEAVSGPVASSNAVSVSSSLSTSFSAVAAVSTVKSGPLPTSRKRSSTGTGGNRRVTRGVARRQKAVADGVDDDDTITIGEYTKAERRRKIARFLEKRQRRKWTHGLMLKCRQVFATNRPRVNGRFVVLPKAICPLIAKGVDMRGYDLSRPQPSTATASASA